MHHRAALRRLAGLAHRESLWRPPGAPHWLALTRPPILMPYRWLTGRLATR